MSSSTPKFDRGAVVTYAPSYFASAWQGHSSGTNQVDTANRTNFAIHVKSRLDVISLKRALARLAALFPVLNCVVNGTCEQPIVCRTDNNALEFEVYDICKTTSGSRYPLALDIISTRVWDGINIKNRAYRITIVDMGNEGFLLAFVMHHFLCDGISIALLQARLKNLYFSANSAKQETTRTSLQYLEYLDAMERWFLTPSYQKNLAYWVNRLATYRSPFVYNETELESQKWSRDTFTIASDELRMLHSIARAAKVTLFSLLMTASSVLAAKLTGKSEVVVSTVTMGRDSPILRDVVGRLTDRNYHRISLDGDPTFYDAIMRVWRTLGEASAHPFVPSDKLKEVLENAGCVLTAPVINFKPYRKTEKAAHNDLWTAITIPLPNTTSRLGNTVYSHWLDMHESASAIHGSIRCLLGFGPQLISAYRAILLEIQRNPYSNISDFLKKIPSPYREADLQGCPKWAD